MIDTRHILREFSFRNLHWFSIIFIFLILSGFFRMYGTTYIEDITDTIQSKQIEGLWFLVFIAVGSQFIFFAARWLVAVICQYLSKRLTLQLRVELFEHMNNISYLVYENYKVGDQQSVIRNDAEKAAEIIYMVYSRIFSNVFAVIFSLSYMYVINPKATFVVLCISIAVAFLNQTIIKPIKKYEVDARQALGDISNIAVNSCSSIDTIKMYNAQTYTVAKYETERDKYDQSMLKAAKITSFREMVHTIINNSILFGCLIVIGTNVIAGHTSLGEALVFITLLSQVTGPIGIIFRWMTSVVSSRAAWERIYRFLQVQPEIESDLIDMETIDSIEMKHVEFNYPNKGPIIDNFDISLLKGKLYALTGESGSGKSTLLKIMMGLYKSPTVQIKLNGKEVANKNLLGCIGYVPSDVTLFNGMSIYENIMLGSRDVSYEECMSWVARIGIQHWISSLPHELNTVIGSSELQNVSGGQKQAIAILRAILARKPVIIMDEPFSALDRDREVDLFKILHLIKKDRIILVTSHREAAVDSYDVNYQLA